MAQALKRLYPDVKFGVGPAIESGFYYDIDTEAVISDESLVEIEKRNAKKLFVKMFQLSAKLFLAKKQLNVSKQLGININ